MKKSILLILGLIIVALLGIRYYIVNKDVAREYYEEKYNMNDWIQLGDYVLQVNSYDVNIKDNEEADVILKASIKNTGDNTIDLENSSLNDSILSIGTIPSAMCYLKGKKEDAQVEVGEIVNVEIFGSFGLDLDEMKQGEEIKLYISGKCYANEIEDYFNNKVLYSKYVQLGEWNFE